MYYIHSYTYVYILLQAIFELPQTSMTPYMYIYIYTHTTLETSENSSVNDDFNGEWNQQYCFLCNQMSATDDESIKSVARQSASHGIGRQDVLVIPPFWGIPYNSLAEDIP